MKNLFYILGFALAIYLVHAAMQRPSDIVWGKDAVERAKLEHTLQECVQWPKLCFAQWK
jgi:hypothetical protein